MRPHPFMIPPTIQRPLCWCVFVHGHLFRSAHMCLPSYTQTTPDIMHHLSGAFTLLEPGLVNHSPIWDKNTCPCFFISLEAPSLPNHHSRGARRTRPLATSCTRARE